MLKPLLFIFLFFTGTLSAAIKNLDWIALEVEACILENTIENIDQEVFPEKTINNKDPETKMPKSGIFHLSYQYQSSYFPELCLLSPFVQAISGFSGFTNLANAP